MVTSLKYPWTKKVTTRETGNITEKVAANYLVEQGLIIQEKNLYSRAGEIDIIMKDGNTIVFIEVKYRASALFGGAISAISEKKQQKIRKTAAFYLQQCGLNEYNTSCRFDVIALQGNINNLDITWLKNAF
ncbi:MULTISPECIES: YraN family protein [unclassified Colwellia]|uniref:YraN family protein n=1 Tax=unclassified Colwellia TaxID=196834 RepID=UPI0015F5A362|nr:MULTISPECIES: YraN family protein [unclassified Colwellia]MBA6232526.1 YraN family protein [Colwellia sp. MB02u-7]MBA6235333.1 YraN family protein [Colwellia sp. MB02u-11]MBA6257844.1 YraN family protein [Colwellia sp. MB3u-28]MBA6258475.1 YraN family protein [Colwellia sp. MB3u-41]MBA6299383.1 YraN family protein [Colwellia sp. MB3u-22]